MSSIEASRGRRVWLAAVTGVPFGVYKWGLGWLLWTRWDVPVGWLVMAWGVADVALNLLAVAWPARFHYCVLSNVGRWLDRRRGSRRWVAILLAIDTTFSFGVVAALVWFGWLPLEPGFAAAAWNLAVVCNVMAVGVERLWESLRIAEGSD